MIIETIPVGPLETNCFLIAAKSGGPAAVIDPGGEPEKIKSAADRLGLEIEKILLTHGHWDHVGGVAALAEMTGAGVLIHESDAELLADPQQNLSTMALLEPRSLTADQLLKDGEVIEVGELQIKVIHTPGHTSGSVSFLVEGNVFNGDLVFYGSIGRTDFPGGSQEEMHRSVHGKIMTLPDETNIFTGHGPPTSVGRERAENPYLAGGW